MPEWTQFPVFDFWLYSDQARQQDRASQLHDRSAGLFDAVSCGVSLLPFSRRENRVSATGLVQALLSGNSAHPHRARGGDRSTRAGHSLSGCQGTIRIPQTDRQVDPAIVGLRLNHRGRDLPVALPDLSSKIDLDPATLPGL